MNGASQQKPDQGCDAGNKKIVIIINYYLLIINLKDHGKATFL